MIIWRGWGVLVVIIAALAIVATQGIVNGVFGDTLFYKTHNWPKGLAFLLAGVVVYFVGRHLNNKPGRAMIDKATGREIILKREHSLFFIRMEYWAFVLAAIGIVLFFIHVG